MQSQGQWFAIDKNKLKEKIPALATVIHAVLSESPTAAEAIGSRLGEETKKTVGSIGSSLGIGQDLTNAFAEWAEDVASEMGKEAASEGSISQSFLEQRMANEFDQWVQAHALSSQALAQEQAKWINRYQELDQRITTTLQEDRSALATGDMATKLESELQTIRGQFYPLANQVQSLTQDIWEAHKVLRNAPRHTDLALIDEVAQEITGIKTNLTELSKQINQANDAYSESLLNFAKVSDHVKQTQSDVCQKAVQAKSAKTPSLPSLQQLRSDVESTLQDRQDVLDITFEDVKRKRLELEKHQHQLQTFIPKITRFRGTKNWESLDRLHQALAGKQQAEALLKQAQESHQKLHGDYQEHLGRTIAAYQRISSVSRTQAESLKNPKTIQLQERFLKIQQRAVLELNDVKTLPQRLPDVPSLHDALSARTDIELITFENLPMFIEKAKAQEHEIKSLEESAKATLSQTDSTLATALSLKAYDQALQQTRGCYQELVEFIESQQQMYADNNTGQGKSGETDRPDSENQDSESDATELSRISVRNS